MLRVILAPWGSHMKCCVGVAATAVLFGSLVSVNAIGVGRRSGGGPRGGHVGGFAGGDQAVIAASNAL